LTFTNKKNCANLVTKVAKKQTMNFLNKICAMIHGQLQKKTTDHERAARAGKSPPGQKPPTAQLL